MYMKYRNPTDYYTYFTSKATGLSGYCPTRVPAVLVVTAAVLSIFLSVCGITGCVSKPFIDPVTAMTDPDLTVDANIRAMKQAALEQPDNEQRIKSLKMIFSESGYTTPMRILAFEQLRENDEDLALQVARLRLPYLPAWDFINYLCVEIARNQWVDFTPSLIRSLSRYTPIYPFKERPEYIALLLLHPDKTLEEIIYEVVSEKPDSPLGSEWRMQAWELLGEVGSVKALYQMLENESIDNDDGFLQDIRAGAMELGVIPVTKEEIKWLRRLRQPEYAQWWEKCASAVESLTIQQRAELSMRHLAVLICIKEHYPQWLTQSRAELVEGINNRLQDRKHYYVNNTYDPVLASDTPQQFSYWQDALTWTDLLTIKLAETMVYNQKVKAELFTQADKDRVDKTTEYGGILDFINDSELVGTDENAESYPAAVAFPPRRRDHDLKFYASREMIDRGYESPFHYHFHVQEVRNTEYAGPGLGDLQYAQSLGINGIVITSVGKNRLNVDYYQPVPKRRVDLVTAEQQIQAALEKDMPDVKVIAVEDSNVIRKSPVVIDLGTIERE